MSEHFPWHSPLAASHAAASQVVRRELQLHRGEHFVLERRPQQQAKTVLLKLAGEKVLELLPPKYSVRSRVHEYGGGSYLVSDLGLFFVEESSQQIHELTEAGSVRQITQQCGARFGDFCLQASARRLVCVRELHSEDCVQNDLVSVCIDSGDVQVLATGADFYSSPSLSANAAEIAFISWSHPNMPWHNTTLWRAKLTAAVSLVDVVAVTDAASSCAQPQWGRAGELYFVDDRSGWWNIWRQSGASRQPEQLLPIDADLGRAQWELGGSSYVILADQSIAAIATLRGSDRILRCRPGDAHWALVDDAYAQCASLGADATHICAIATTAVSSAEVVSIPLANKLESESVARAQSDSLLAAADLPLPVEYVSVAESIEFEARDGSIAQGFFYPPNKLGLQQASAPPLLVVMHGGPTSACSNSFSSLVQYWTTRGLAVFDLNYRGSTGFGRDYRLALAGRWGVADVEDCEDAVVALAQMGKIDSQRVAIRGGSAGGFTALAAAVNSEVFAVVGCHYGVADLELLARDTHKFESRYLDHLIGTYPERRDLYRQRSPLHHLHKINCPVFISHGLLDSVVPVNQAYEMSEALQAKGLEVELLLFDDERHGYGQEKNIATLLERELAFYAKTFARRLN